MTILRVPRPRVDAVRRQRAGAVSVADAGIVRAGPGLLALLQNPIGGAAEPIAAGLQPGYAMPFGLAVSAALTVLEAGPAGREWAVRDASIDWSARAADLDEIVAEARVAEVDSLHVRFDFTASTAAGLPLLAGSMRIVPMRSGRYEAMADVIGLPAATSIRAVDAAAPHVSAAPEGLLPVKLRDGSAGGTSIAPGVPVQVGPLPEPPQRDLFLWRSPEIDRDGARLRLTLFPELLRFLMNPLAGAAEPIGRRIHPQGGMILGAALSAALAAAGEGEPWNPRSAFPVHAEITWLLPASQDDVVVAECTVPARIGDASACRIAIADSVGRTLGVATVQLLHDAQAERRFAPRI